MSRRVLLMLPQMPFDPAAGAPKSVRATMRVLADAGFDVRALSTTMTAFGIVRNPAQHLIEHGLRPQIDQDRELGVRLLRFDDHAIPTTLLDTGDLLLRNWEPSLGKHFDALTERTVADFKPEVAVTYGGSKQNIARRARLRQLGVAVAFGLRNVSYLARGSFVQTDAVFTPSRFLTDVYARTLGLRSTPLPTPIYPEDTVNDANTRTELVIVNPTVPKGMMLVVRLIEEVSNRRPDIPIRVIQAMRTQMTLQEAGEAGGFDLSRHPNITLAQPVPRPRDVFATARVLLMPSLWPEPSGRTAIEALANGVPPVVSDRGGLPESVGDGGTVVPVSPDLTDRVATPPPPSVVEPWIDAIVPMFDDDARYNAACEQARRAGRRYLPEQVRDPTVEFFGSVRLGPPDPGGPYAR